MEIARSIAEKAGVEFHLIDASFISKLGTNSLTDSSIEMDQEKPADSFPNTFVPGRNLFFLSIAAVFAREHGNEWMLTLTIAAVLELYTAFRMPQAEGNK